MRLVILAVSIFLIFAGGKAFGDYCAKPDKIMSVAPQPVTEAYYSSFRGISLASRPDNVPSVQPISRAASLRDLPCRSHSTIGIR